MLINDWKKLSLVRQIPGYSFSQRITCQKGVVGKLTRYFDWCLVWNEQFGLKSLSRSCALFSVFLPCGNTSMLREAGFFFLTKPLIYPTIATNSILFSLFIAPWVHKRALFYSHTFIFDFNVVVRRVLMFSLCAISVSRFCSDFVWYTSLQTLPSWWRNNPQASVRIRFHSQIKISSLIELGISIPSIDYTNPLRFDGKPPDLKN